MSDIVNRVRVLAPSATGTSSAALGSAYSAKYLTPAEAGCIDGRRYTWLIEQGNDVEVVQGAWSSSGNIAARTKVIFSKIAGSIGTAKINLNGTAVVSIVQAAEDMGALRGSRTVTGASDTIAASDLGRAVIYNRATTVAVSIGQAGDTGGFIEGWLTWFQNKGAGAVTITPATSTIDGAATLVLAQNQGALIWSDGTNYQVFRLGNIWDGPVALTAAQQNQLQKNAGVPAIMRGYIAGLLLSPTVTATFSVSAGVAVDSSNAEIISLPASITKNYLSWALGNNAGGLDAGSASIGSFYHVFVIKRADTGVVDVLFSLSATSPSLPTNYTHFRRIGSIRYNSGSWFKFLQFGDEFFWDTPVADIATTSQGTTSVLYPLTVPAGVSVKARLEGYVQTSAVGNVATLSSPLQNAPGANAPTGHTSVVTAVAATPQVTGQIELLTDTFGQIRAIGSVASTSMNFVTLGWRDDRGRNS